jgi:hypothetical protein
VGRRILFATLLGVVRRIAGDRPLVLALDDIHLGDTETLDWIEFAHHSAADLRLLVVVTRPSGEGPLAGVFQTVDLQPLDLAAVEAIAGPQRAAALHARSGGNPLLLTALAAVDVELPATVVEAVDRHLRSAGAAALTIRTAAILGEELDLELLVSLLNLRVASLLEHLETGARLGFLDDRQPTMTFRRPLVREALVAATPIAWREFILRAAARIVAAGRLTPGLPVDVSERGAVAAVEGDERVLMLRGWAQGQSRPRSQRGILDGVDAPTADELPTVGG